MLLASLFTISRFINYSELIAMKSAGISIFRYLFPILLFGGFITCFSVYFNGWIVPTTNSKKIDMERYLLGKEPSIGNISNFYFQDKVNKLLYFSTYDRNSQTASNVSIQVFNKDTLTKLQYRFDAKKLAWDSTTSNWRLYGCYKRTFTSLEKEYITFIDSALISSLPEIKVLTITPDIIIKKQVKPEELNLSDFKMFIDKLKESGLEVKKAEVDYYSIISFPFASLVTILFGVSVSSNRRKGGAALQFGISMIVSFIYLGFVKISQVFGYNGDLNPILTAWLANILFLAISLLNFYRLNKH